MGYTPFTIDLIDNRFLLYQLEWDNVTELLTLAIRDLGSKEIAMKEFSLAINHSSLSDFSLDAGMASQTDTHVNFTIAIRTAKFIQLWNYDLTTNQTTKISELQWETSCDNQLYSSSSYSKILLLNDSPFWRLFCPVMTNLNSREIFHISFNGINGIWSISQFQIQNIL
jgi:hypothetical protein